MKKYKTAPWRNEKWGWRAERIGTKLCL